MDREQRAAWGPAIRDARQARQMSQQELADLADTTRRTVYSIETGANTPQLAVLERILEVLDLAKPELSHDPEVETYLSMLSPLIQQIPPSRRAEALRRVVLDLTSAISAYTVVAEDKGRGDGFGIDPVSER